MKIKNKIIVDDIKDILSNINLDCLKNKTILITGASGFLGSLLTTTFLYANQTLNANIKIITTSRKEIFSNWYLELDGKEYLKHIKQNIVEQININEKIDFIIHTASPTDSSFLKNNPIETFDTILIGTKNIINLALKNNAYLINLSSMEVYSSNNTLKVVNEEECGTFDLYNTRNSYPIAKISSEFLCNTYAQTNNLKVANVRLAQTIDAGIKYEENKVFMMFLKSCLNNEDIVLLTTGQSIRSVIYSSDALRGILFLLTNNYTGTYNLANEEATLSIYNLAEKAIKTLKPNKTKIVIKTNTEQGKVYSSDSKIQLDTSKIKTLGWSAKINVEEMFIKLKNSFN